MAKRPQIPNARWHGRQYWFRANLGGQSVVRPLGADPAEARRLAFLYKQELRTKRAQGRRLPGTVSEYTETWLKSYVAKRRVLRSQATTRFRMEEYVLPILGKLRLNEVRRAHLEKLIDSLQSRRIGRQEKPLSVNSVRHILSDVRCMFSYAVQMEEIEYSPFRKGIMPRKPEAAPKPLTEDELPAILKASEEPIRSAIVLAERTGLRWSEQRDLQWRHVELGDDPCLVVDETKDGKWRRVPLDPIALEIVKRWKETRSSVFVMPWRPKVPAWAYRRTRHVTKWHWHRLRHTAACRWLQQGLSIEYVSELLGHSSVETTQIYAKLSERTVRAEFRRRIDNPLQEKLARELATNPVSTSAPVAQVDRAAVS